MIGLIEIDSVGFKAHLGVYEARPQLSGRLSKQSQTRDVVCNLTREKWVSQETHKRTMVLQYHICLLSLVSVAKTHLLGISSLEHSSQRKNCIRKLE